MNNIAIVFSGQGAQFAQMGKTNYENSLSARKIFEKAAELNPKIYDICFEGTGLDRTENVQPALYVCSIAGAAALEEMGVKPYFCGGFSVGEIAALCYCKMLSFEQGYKLIERRAQFMQECADKYGGAMAAVLGDNRNLEELLTDFKNLYIANYNSNNQTVIAGDADELNNFLQVLKQNKIRGIKLKVSGAFHTPFMQDASDKMSKYLENVKFAEHESLLYSNTTANIYENPQKLIPMQITSAVQWKRQIENMHAKGAQVFIESGAGDVLCKLIKNIIPNATAFVQHDENIKDLIKGELCKIK